jgi:hypothetical protein
MPVVTRHKPIGTPNNVENTSEEQNHLFIAKPSPLDIKLCDPVLSELWLQIDGLTDKQGSSYGVVKKVIKQNTTKFPWLTRDLLYNYRKKATKQLQLPPLDVNCGKPQGTLVSDLTSKIIMETASHVEGSPLLSKDNPSHLLAGSSSTLSPDHPTDIVPNRWKAKRGN